MEQRDAAFSHWITAYFKHGDVTLHNPSALSYVVPATTRVPSIYNMSKNELARMVHPRKTPGADLLLVSGASSRVLNASYKKACYDPTVRTQLPSMKVWVVNGDSSASICVAAFWAVEDDDKARGGGCVNFRMVPGGNHFASAVAASKDITALIMSLTDALGRARARTSDVCCGRIMSSGSLWGKPYWLLRPRSTHLNELRLDYWLQFVKMQ